MEKITPKNLENYLFLRIEKGISIEDIDVNDTFYNENLEHIKTIDDEGRCAFFLGD